MRILILFVICLFSTLPARAHQNSIAFLLLEQTNGMVRARWDIPLHDLTVALKLDLKQNDEITLNEIRPHATAIQDYALRGLTLRRSESLLKPVLTDLLLQRRVTGTAVRLMWEAPVHQNGLLSLEYNFQFELDPGHQCIVVYRDRTAALSKGQRLFSFEAESRGHAFSTFVREGVVHIFMGIDHIYFLLALMLPAVWRRSAAGWQAVGSFRGALLAITKIVTAFTAAHSITLSLAALRVISLPSVLVESIIAVSVLVAALNNLRPLWTDRCWLVAFAFGLVHGFGFANALAELPTGAGSLVLSLAGFNLGVEIGQLCIVLAFLPVAFVLRESWFYRWCAVRAGSIGIAGIAAIWFMERAFHIPIF
jgi:hypothetical protein